VELESRWRRPSTGLLVRRASVSYATQSKVFFFAFALLPDLCGLSFRLRESPEFGLGARIWIFHFVENQFVKSLPSFPLAVWRMQDVGCAKCGRMLNLRFSAGGGLQFCHDFVLFTNSNERKIENWKLKICGYSTEAQNVKTWLCLSHLPCAIDWIMLRP